MPKEITMNLDQMTEVPKRSADYLLALIDFVRDPDKYAAFIEKMDAALAEQKRIELAGREFKEVDALIAKAKRDQAKADSANDKAQAIIDAAQNKADKLEAAKQAAHDAALSDRRVAEALKTEAADLKKEADDLLKDARNQRAVAIEMNHAAKAKLLEAKAEKAKYEQAIERLKEITEVK